MWLTLVTDCERTNVVAVSWMDGWKLPTRSTTALSNFQFGEWWDGQSLERSTLELRKISTTTTTKTKIVGCCAEIYFVCLNCKVKFVLPQLKKGMRPPASFRGAMVNEWIEDFITRRHWTLVNVRVFCCHQVVRPWVLLFVCLWVFRFKPNHSKQTVWHPGVISAG